VLTDGETVTGDSVYLSARITTPAQAPLGVTVFGSA
jgi:hypothetical protein